MFIKNKMMLKKNKKPKINIKSRLILNNIDILKPKSRNDFYHSVYLNTATFTNTQSPKYDNLPDGKDNLRSIARPSIIRKILMSKFSSNGKKSMFQLNLRCFNIPLVSKRNVGIKRDRKSVV